MSIRVGLFGFGRTGRAVASVLLHSKDTWLAWVARKSHRMEDLLRPFLALGEAP